MGKGRVIVDQAYYDRVLDAFRVSEGSIAGAARLAKISRRTAQKAYHKGWEKHEFPPIKKMLEIEKLEMRKKRTEEMDGKLASLKEDKILEEAASRAAARRDAINARIEEGKMIKAARQSAIGLLESTKSVTAAINDIAPDLATAIRRLKDQILDDAEPSDIGQITKFTQLIWRVSIAMRAASATSHQILQSERLLLGQPTDIIGVTDMDNMSETEAISELEEAANALERIKARKARRGSFKIIEGGNNKEKAG